MTLYRWTPPVDPGETRWIDGHFYAWPAKFRPVTRDPETGQFTVHPSDEPLPSELSPRVIGYGVVNQALRDALLAAGLGLGDDATGRLDPFELVLQDPPPGSTPS